jgi:general secretion pathway protein D
MIRTLYFSTLLFTCLFNSAHSQTISEKKAGLSSGATDLSSELQNYLSDVNKDLASSENELQVLYKDVWRLYKENAPECEYKILMERIAEVREHMSFTENSWREMATNSATDESYALWHQPDATLGQLIIDYGSNNYVYLLPQEISSIKLNVDSNLPIPRSSWNEMLEVILTQNGVGIKQLNPYLRQLYFIKEDKSNLQLITSKRQDLEFLRPDERICFVITPEPVEIRRTFAFLEKFINPNSTALQMIGRDIIVIAQVAEIQDLLKLFDFVSCNRGDKEYKVISLRRVDADEMARILGAIFDHMGDEGGSVEAAIPAKKGSKGKSQPQANISAAANGLKIIALSHVAKAMFLVGTKEEIKKAEDIISQVENQVGDAREKVIFWYTAKHSDPAELAEVLEKIYNLMSENRFELDSNDEKPKNGILAQAPPPPGALPFTRPNNPPQPYPPGPYDDGYYLNERFVVDDSPVDIDRSEDPNANRNNFIVDVKTGSIVMVVDADILPKMKDLLRKLDVPKKMVQIEVLLFEKRIEKQNDFGLNLLKIGCLASDVNCTSFLFNDIGRGSFCKGVTEFFFSSKKTDSGIPAFDAVYKFLLAQDDIQINANPSILTINQTPAKIEIAEEISVNTGVYQVETNKGVTLKDSFARATYGIKIEITPTIHLHDSECDDDPLDYVTLVSDIMFETIHPKLFNRDRPDVTRRLINNEVRVADGQTIILGGLRRKITCDTKESIPFLGELPGLGKLFSITSLHDNSTEMFIFITPKIVIDPAYDLERIRQEELCKRPGDIPYFLCCLVSAREREKNRLMQESIRMLLGREPQCKFYPCGEYDGR